MRKKTIIRLIPITIPAVIIAVILISILPSSLRTQDKRQTKAMSTSEEWFFQQEDYIEELGAYSEGLDYSVAAYVSGESSLSVFSSELDALKRQIWLMRMDYENTMKEKRIVFSAYDQVLQLGCEDIHGCYISISNMLDEITAAIISPEQVLYISISYADEIQNHISGYRASRMILYGMDGQVTYATPEIRP